MSKIGVEVADISPLRHREEQDQNNEECQEECCGLGSFFHRSRGGRFKDSRRRSAMRNAPKELMC